MGPKKRLLEFIHPREEASEGRYPSVRELVNGTAFSKGILNNLGFVFWLALLGIVYIGNNYHAQKVAREIAKLKTEVNELRAESTTTAARLMYVSRQSVVTDMIRKRGMNLEEAVTPPYIIKR